MAYYQTFKMQWNRFLGKYGGLMFFLGFIGAILAVGYAVIQSDNKREKEHNAYLFQQREIALTKYDKWREFSQSCTVVSRDYVSDARTVTYNCKGTTYRLFIYAEEEAAKCRRGQACMLDLQPNAFPEIN